jgi:hypothetical protein
MILDLNNLAVESFETHPDALADPPPVGMPTNQPILCLIEGEPAQTHERICTTV